MRPSFNFFALMYFQSFLVASGRVIFFPPQIAASAGLKFTGAKRPMPFFFAAEAAFLAPAFRFFRACTRLICSVLFDGGFVFFVVVFAIVVFLVVVAFLVVAFLAAVFEAVFVIAVGWTHKSGALSQEGHDQ